MPEQHQLHLPEKYLQQVHALLRQHIPQAEVWAYGSRVHGDGFEASDLDLVARFSDGAAPEAMRLGPLREALTESNLPIFVQIVDWASIPAAFREEILARYVVVQRVNGIPTIPSLHQ